MVSILLKLGRSGITVIGGSIVYRLDVDACHQVFWLWHMGGKNLNRRVLLSLGGQLSVLDLKYLIDEHMLLIRLYIKSDHEHCKHYNDCNLLV